MSAVRDLGRNGGGEDSSAKVQGRGRRNLIREERDSKSRSGSSWRQSEGRGVDTQQHEETAPERMRSISTGRIPLDGRRSISSTRVGIGARRVRSTSAARSVEASRRPLGESLKRQLGEENTLHTRGLGNFNERGQSHSPTLGREQSRSRKRVTFCEEVTEYEPCNLSYDSMEEGEVGSQEEQEDDTDTEEEDEQVKEADQGVEEKEEIDDGDGDMRDVEVRSSSPPSVWTKKAD